MPGLSDADGTPPDLGRLVGEAVAGDGRQHEVERVLGASAVRGRVGEWADGLEQLDDRARPAVRHDQRQRVLVGRLHVDEVDVQPVDLGLELRQRVESRLTPAPVVLGRPVAGELLHRRQLHALRPIGDEFLGRPASRMRSGRRRSSIAPCSKSTANGLTVVSPPMIVTIDRSRSGVLVHPSLLLRPDQPRNRAWMLFVATAQPAAVGGLLTLELSLPGGDGPIVLESCVRWVRRRRVAGRRDRPAGMGLQFVNLTTETSSIIGSFLQAHLSPFAGRPRSRT